MKALTPEEYAEKAPTRPYTDKPLGGSTGPRRNRDARLSARMKGYERSRRPFRDWVKVQSPWTGRCYWVRSGTDEREDAVSAE